MYSSTEDGTTAINQSNRRQINKLQNLLAQNQVRFDACNKQIDAYWCAHLDTVRESNR